MITNRFWDSINIPLLWKNLGTIWCLLMEEWSILGSWWNSALVLFCFPSTSLRAEGYVTATSAQSVTRVSISWSAVHSDSHEGSSSPWCPIPKASWELCVYPTPRTQETCQDVIIPIQHNSVLNKILSLDEGQPSVHQKIIHLTQGLRNLHSLPNLLWFGLSSFRVLSNYILHYTAYYKVILYPC